MTALVSYNTNHEDDPGYNANGTRMSRNQLAEQWYAYKWWAAEPRGNFCDMPHTLNCDTCYAVLRKELRI